MSDDNNDKWFNLTDDTYERLHEDIAQNVAEGNKKYGCGGGNGNGNGNGKNQGDNIQQTIAEILIKLAIQNTKLFFKDQYGIPYALVNIVDHYEITRVESGKFKRYLGMLFYDTNNKVANAEAITNAVHVLQAKAENGDKTFPLSLRVTWDNEEDILYDLTNEKWQCVKISKQNWEVLNNTPNPTFIRYNQIPQVHPDRNYEQDIFDSFLQLTNLKEEKDRILLKVYIISTFIPDIPHAMLILHGEKGSAKSTLQTLIKLLVDPAKPRLLTIYSDVKEFIQQLAHNYVAFYDNLKHTPLWLSDEACKAVTGVGSTKRRLYSDDDDIVYEYRRCLGFNGINNSLTEPDALDRSMMIELQRIRKENARQDGDIMTQFLELRPQLLGYIFDILVKTLQIKPTVELNDLPRMADFAIWGEAIARAMGYKDLEFINAYYENIGKQNVEAIENHPFGQALARYMGDNEVLKGAPLEILEILEVFAHTNGIKTDHKLWPKSPNMVTRRLNQIRSNLLEGLGIDVQITRVTTVKGKFNTSYIEVLKVSPEPPEPPETQNHEGNTYHITGDTLATGGMISPVSEIPPVKTSEKRAQNDISGDTGDTGGCFSITRDGCPDLEDMTDAEKRAAYDTASAKALGRAKTTTL